MRGFFKNRSQEPPAGCGFFSSKEIAAFLEGQVSPERLDRFREHQRGCSECLHLDRALELFREILDQGVLETERSGFSRVERSLQARLRIETEQHAERGPGARNLSSGELELIAAAGRNEPVATPASPRDIEPAESLEDHGEKDETL